jgi:hypothetical protein
MTSTFGIAAPFLIRDQLTAVGPSRYGRVRKAKARREIGVMRFADGKWKEAWYFADELGLMLQLNALHMLEV